MFTRFALKDSVEFTDNEYSEVHSILDKWKEKVGILNKVDYRSIKLKWCKAMDINGVLGAYDFYTDAIYVYNSNQIEMACPVICHELVHYNQRKCYGSVLYSILAFPLWRNWTIEPEAYKVEDICYDLINFQKDI